MDIKIKNMSNHAQVTFFVIAAIVILAIIGIIFYMRGGINLPGIASKAPDIQKDMEACTKKAVEQAVEIMLPQGGYLKPELGILYKNNNVAYLCYVKNYYANCINQQPMYINHLTEEIESYISGKIEDCFYKLEQDYEEKGYSVYFGVSNLDVNLNPEQISVVIDKKIEISKKEENINYNQLDYSVTSPIYNLGLVAQEIVGQEAKYCNFEYLGYQIFYQDFSIGKTDIDGDTKLYFIKDKKTGKELTIAIRSCVMPAGGI